jgi:GAF domain-containing protein
VLVEDLRREPLFLHRELVLASGYESLVCMPLIAQTRAVGTLQLYGRAERHLSPESLPLLQAIAEQPAVAIANTHLHQTLKASEAEYRRSVENLSKLIFGSPGTAVMGRTV